MVNDPEVWQYLQTVVWALFPGIIILWLADADKPNMDKLYFCPDNCLNKSKELLDMGQEKLYKTLICYRYDNIDGTDKEDEFVVDDCPSEDDSDNVMVASF